MKLICLPRPFDIGNLLILPEDVQHRLYRVMRMGAGSVLHAFNGTGQAAYLEIADAKCRTARVVSLLPAKPELPTRILALGVPKREAWETAVRQATELGVTSIIPLKTKFSQISKLNLERAQNILIEAAEQSERYVLPQLLPLTGLEDFLGDLTTPCLWAYERLLSSPPTPNPYEAPSTVLVGPEGGFAPEEIAALSSHNAIRPFTLGPTILRTDTAVVAALTHLGLARRNTLLDKSN